MIHCRILGPALVTVDGHPAPPELLWRKNLALLIYLARAPRRSHTREHLTGLLWHDKPEAAARHSLNEAVRVLRRIGGTDTVLSDGGQVSLAADAVRLDTEELAEQLAGGNLAAAALVAGSFLEGFSIPGATAFEDWLAAEREQWRRTGVQALAGLAEQQLAGGHPHAAVESAERALRLDPASGVALRALLRALALAGDPGAALARYTAYTAYLDQEFGGDPDGETQALARRLRRPVRWGAAAPAWTAGPARRPPLSGREAELGRLLHLWNEARAGPARLALVSADSGMGKSRLVEELLLRTRLESGAVLQTRAVPSDESEPCGRLLDLARGELLDLPGIAAAPPAAICALAERIPEWQERFPGAAAAGALPPVTHAVADVLRAALEESPAVLAIDDAQWADGPTLEAVGALLRDLRAHPLLVVLSFAPRPARPELDGLQSRLGRETPGDTVHPGPLQEDALRELARWWLPSYDEEALHRITRRVAADSAGTPLLAAELFRAVASGLDLDRESPAWPAPFRTMDQTRPGDLPAAIVAAIRIAFRRLSAAAQHVLTAAAVLDDRVTEAQLAAATGLGSPTLRQALDELEWSRWLAADPRGYTFVARLVREVVGDDMVTRGERERIRTAVSGER